MLGRTWWVGRDKRDQPTINCGDKGRVKNVRIVRSVNKKRGRWKLVTKVVIMFTSRHDVRERDVTSEALDGRPFSRARLSST